MKDIKLNLDISTVDLLLLVDMISLARLISSWTQLSYSTTVVLIFLATRRISAKLALQVAIPS